MNGAQIKGGFVSYKSKFFCAKDFSEKTGYSLVLGAASTDKDNDNLLLIHNFVIA